MGRKAIKDRKESVASSQHGFRKGNFCLSNLIVFYDEMAEGEKSHLWSQISIVFSLDWLNCKVQYAEIIGIFTEWWRMVKKKKKIIVLKFPLETIMVLPFTINELDLGLQVLITACVKSLGVTSTSSKSWNTIFTGTISGRGLLVILGLYFPFPQVSLNEGRLLTKTT